MGEHVHEICTVPGCGRPHKSLGYCNTHYQRHKRGKPIDTPLRGPGRPRCSVMGCESEVHARGLCLAHYSRQKRGADVGGEIKRRGRNGPEICIVEGCDKPAKSKGMCQMHYARKLRHGFTKRPDRTKPHAECSIEGCENNAYANGLCNAHYLRSRKAESFGLTLADVIAMAAAQGNVCAICGQPPNRIAQSGKPTDFDIDHDHETGAARGLLCSSCNRAIGLLGDSPERLRAAAAYIERHRANESGSALRDTGTLPERLPDSAGLTALAFT